MLFIWSQLSLQRANSKSRVPWSALSASAGFITRSESEQLLQRQAAGSFLVRVHERIRGYVISYWAGDRCKHYLIDASLGHCQFFGSNQVVFPKLRDLVRHHTVSPSWLCCISLASCFAIHHLVALWASAALSLAEKRQDCLHSPRPAFLRLSVTFTLCFTLRLDTGKAKSCHTSLVQGWTFQ